MSTKRLAGVLLVLVGCCFMVVAAWAFAAASVANNPFAHVLALFFLFGPYTEQEQIALGRLSLVLFLTSLSIGIVGMLMIRSGGASERANSNLQAQTSTQRAVAERSDAHVANVERVSPMWFWKHSWKHNFLLAGIAFLVPVGMVIPIAIIAAILPSLYEPLSSINMKLAMVTFVLSAILLLTAILKYCHALIRRIWSPK